MPWFYYCDVYAHIVIDFIIIITFFKETASGKLPINQVFLVQNRQFFIGFSDKERNQLESVSWNR